MPKLINFVCLIADWVIAYRYSGGGGCRELLAVGADACDRVHILRFANLLSVFVAEHQAPGGCE